MAIGAVRPRTVIFFRCSSSRGSPAVYLGPRPASIYVRFQSRQLIKRLHFLARRSTDCERRRRVPIGPTMGNDNVFRKPIEAGLIPGVVGLAAHDRGVFYEGAFGRRTVDKPENDAQLCIPHCLDDQGCHQHTAAMQRVEEGRIGLPQLNRRAMGGQYLSGRLHGLHCARRPGGRMSVRLVQKRIRPN
jgi:hypothetical protein